MAALAGGSGHKGRRPLQEDFVAGLRGLPRQLLAERKPPCIVGIAKGDEVSQRCVDAGDIKSRIMHRPARRAVSCLNKRRNLGWISVWQLGTQD